MLFGHKRKNQNAIYLCNHWIHYETHFTELCPVEIRNAKELFSGLQKLDQEERLYLAAQYRTARGKKYTDGEIAELKGIPVEEHRKMRNSIQDKLQAALVALHEVLEGGDT